MKEATARGMGAIDPFWIDPHDDMLTVSMTPTHAVAYQRWLRSMNLHLFRIPEETETVYTVGIRWMVGDERHDDQGQQHES